MMPCTLFIQWKNDDTVIAQANGIICAIAVLNDELYWDHAVSSVITLEFIRGKTKEKE